VRCAAATSRGWPWLIDEYDVQPHIRSRYSDAESLEITGSEIAGGILRMQPETSALLPVDEERILIVGGVFDGETIDRDPTTAVLEWAAHRYVPIGPRREEASLVGSTSAQLLSKPVGFVELVGKTGDRDVLPCVGVVGSSGDRVGPAPESCYDSIEPLDHRAEVVAVPNEENEVLSAEAPLGDDRLEPVEEGLQLRSHVSPEHRRRHHDDIGFTEQWVDGLHVVIDDAAAAVSALHARAAVVDVHVNRTEVGDLVILELAQAAQEVLGQRVRITTLSRAPVENHHLHASHLVRKLSDLRVSPSSRLPTRGMSTRAHQKEESDEGIQKGEFTVNARFLIRNVLIAGIAGVLGVALSFAVAAEEIVFPPAFATLGSTQTGSDVQSASGVIKTIHRLALDCGYTDAEADELVSAVGTLIDSDIPPGTLLQVAKALLPDLGAADLVIVLEELGQLILDGVPPGQAANQLLERGKGNGNTGGIAGGGNGNGNTGDIAGGGNGNGNTGGNAGGGNGNGNAGGNAGGGNGNGNAGGNAGGGNGNGNAGGKKE
jgi:hypothetical protein